MFLALSVGEIIGLTGAMTTVFTAFIVPIYRYTKNKKKLRREELERQKQRDIKIGELCDKISNIDDRLKENTKRDIQIKNTLDNFKNDYKKFSIQNLKFMINDAYLSYPSVKDILKVVHLYYLFSACSINRDNWIVFNSPDKHISVSLTVRKNRQSVQFILSHLKFAIVDIAFINFLDVFILNLL